MCVCMHAHVYIISMGEMWRFARLHTNTMRSYYQMQIFAVGSADICDFWRKYKPVSLFLIYVRAQPAIESTKNANGVLAIVRVVKNMSVWNIYSCPQMLCVKPFLMEGLQRRQ